MTSRPPIPKPPYTGGCLCGAVTWQLNERPLAINACHCIDCKKTTGATNVIMLIARKEAFVVTGEMQSYRKRADSGRELDIYRCVHCGTRIFHHNLASNALVFVTAGTLDDSSWAVPSSHIWVEKVSPGVVMQDDAIKLEGQPADRKILMDAFTAIYGDGA
ncbi:MAG TPA: GFA family protein [Rhizomicrobium sp.]|nr:GFA family protein [Rhizomicrobium sp.]